MNALGVLLAVTIAMALAMTQPGYTDSQISGAQDAKVEIWTLGRGEQGSIGTTEI